MQKPKNPFIVSGMINPDYFCDRQEEARKLIAEVTNGNNLLIISPRRMGKTGLINYCLQKPEIAESYNCFFFDILQTSDLREFTFLLGKEIFSRLASHGEKRIRGFVAALRSLTGKFGFDVVTGSPTFNVQLGDLTHPELTLQEIFAYLEGSATPSIVAIDEFQQVSSYPEKNVEAILRTHIQHSSNCSFIFAGSERHILQQMFTDSARPFYNSASVIELKRIDKDIYLDFIDRLFRERNKSIEREASGLLYDRIDGNTFYVQKCCNMAFSMTSIGETCDEQMIEDVIREQMASYDTIYRERLSAFGVTHKQLLLAIATEKEATRITSSEFIRRHTLASASAVQSATRRLMDADLITRLGNIYTITDPLFRLWLLATYTNK